MNYLLIIILYAFLEKAYGFMPRIKLKSLVQFRAFYTTIIEKFSLETLNDTILEEAQGGFDLEKRYPLYLVMFLYLVNLTQPDNTKLENVELYKKNVKKIREVIFLFWMIFMKNVEAAT
jgi:hypothetical protein